MCFSRKYPYLPTHGGVFALNYPPSGTSSFVSYFLCGRRSGLMVSALVSGSSGLGLSPGREHCVVFLGKTPYSHSVSLHPGVSMGTSNLNAGGNPTMDQHPIQGGVEILLAVSCYRNQDNLQPDESLGLYADFTFYLVLPFWPDPQWGGQ